LKMGGCSNVMLVFRDVTQIGLKHLYLVVF